MAIPQRDASAFLIFSFILFKRQLIWNWDGWVRGWRILEILQQAVAKRVAIPKLKSHLNAIEIYVNWWYAYLILQQISCSFCHVDVETV